MSCFARIPAVFSLTLFCASCGLPRDPEKTSERIAERHELRVGYTGNSPWTEDSGGEPSGIEPDLVRAFARSVGASIAWTRGSETTLVQGLKRHELDLVIGGFDKQTQWSASAAVSQPFAKDSEGKKRVVLTAPGENRFALTVDRFMTERLRQSEQPS